MNCSLAVENKHARDLAEKEKRMREQDQAAARKKDAEMSGMSHYACDCAEETLS